MLKLLENHDAAKEALKDFYKEKKIKENPSDSTLEMRVTAFHTIIKKIPDLFTNHDEFLLFLSETKKPATALIYLNSIIIWGLFFNKDVSFFNDLKKEYLVKERDHKKENSKQEKLKATYEELQKACDYWKNKDIQKYLVCLLNLELPIRNDLFTIKIKKYDTTYDNYYDGDGKIILNKYKTSAVYGRREFKLESATLKILKQLIQDRREWLFLQKNNSPFDNKKMTIYIRDIYLKSIKKALGIREIRKIKINYEYSFAESLDQMKEIANKYMHSLGTELNYYTKDSNLDVSFKLNH
jgi:hypothetical protein